MSVKTPSNIRLSDLLASNSSVLVTDTMRFLPPSGLSLQHHHHDRQEFSQSNLVSDDQPGHLNAQVQDPNLINPWGIAFSRRPALSGSRKPHRHSDALLVDPTTDRRDVPADVPLVVTIAPPPAVRLQRPAPTGIVFNTDPNPGFIVNGKPACSSSTTEDGTISAWNGGTQTTLEVDNSSNAALGDPTVRPEEGIGAVYKGSGDCGTAERNDAAVRCEFPARYGGCVQRSVAADQQPDRWQRPRRLRAV